MACHNSMLGEFEVEVLGLYLTFTTKFTVEVRLRIIIESTRADAKATENPLRFRLIS